MSFPIGIFAGQHKPNNVIEYLRDFTDEYFNLFHNGFTYISKKFYRTN